MNRVVLVLGMHRSGTSMVAGSLESLGVELGDRAKWSGLDNPQFNEDQDVLAIDQRILSLLGCDWDTLALPLIGRTVQWEVFPWAIGLLTERLSRMPLYGIKEPRMCRLLPFWRPALGHVGAEVSVVHVIRHPMAVARSLGARAGIGSHRDLSVSCALSLWRDHVRHQYADVDPTWPAMTVDYDRMLADPVHELSRIASGVDLQIQRDGLVRFLDKDLRGDLRHHEVTGDLPEAMAEEWATLQEKAI